MVVDAEDDPVVQGLSRLDQPLRGLCDRLARLEDALVAVRQPLPVQPDALPAILDECLRLGEGRVLVPLARRREAGHEVAVPAAQELVDRYAQRLALDVVEGDVDGGERPRQDATPLEVLAPVHQLPERSGVHRVHADQELPVVSDRPDHGKLTA